MSLESHNSQLNKPNPSLGHRRQASIGLGIITNLDNTTLDTTTTVSTKNASFFETSDIAIPRPPPRLFSIEKPQHITPTPLEENTPTYASRLRNIIIMNNNNNNNNNQLQSTNTAPTPTNDIKQQQQFSDTLSDQQQELVTKVRRARSYRFRPPYYQDDDDDDDQIMPLPSPVPNTTTSSTPHKLPYELHHHQQQRSGSISVPASNIPSSADPSSSALHIPALPNSPVTPPSPTTSTSIPIIAISPSFVHKNDVIPQLSDHPMLGDMDDNRITSLNIQKSTFDKRKIGGMVRETTQASTTLNNDEDEDLIDKQLGDFYIRRLLGMGAFSKVYLGERHNHQKNKGPEFFAIKTINKLGMMKNPRVRSSIEREVGVLKFIDHPHIVRIEATMETEHSLCIILEYAKGVELFDFVQQLHQRLHAMDEKVDENLVKQIFLQLVHVVKWMHKHNIVHRDLKLENILIHMNERHEPSLKVTDFGLARVIDPDSPILTTRCGSEDYAAPEIVQSKGYDGRQTDTWALGIILYSLLVGYLPFRYDVSKGERVTQMFYRIVRAQIKWPKTWDLHCHLAISSQAKDVVERILVRQPELRISLDDIERLPWFQQ
ncbi:kinase-like domain-containing protein [Halteromyces radiatus]|uniref:kinase-like domain-containing protein n=1 Tax=Halteromyces radiatus TaxID=101107 RepID=UPI00221FB014|nr:kinase-like domain-containing protein [Halteromyces radiatus]KAI8093325.1 kinase-like domain-containing protein [Halteromyces radiatus]